MHLQAIVTHPGSAHKDEFLACCVLLAEHPVAIYRREPSPEDLANPRIAVLDVGDQHSVALNNYDHHQFPRETAPTCSLSLVLQALGLYQDARNFCDWLEPAEWFDCRGPQNTAAHLGVERDIISKLSSPIDLTLLRRFALAPELAPGTPLWQVMQMVGEDLLDYLRTLRARLDYIQAHAQIWDFDQDGSPAKALFLPRLEPLPDDPSFGLPRYIEAHGLQQEIVGLIYPDRRSSGYGLTRFNDNPRLDFTQVESEPDVHFAHKAGFVAKTTATQPARLKALFTQALSPQPEAPQP